LYLASWLSGREGAPGLADAVELIDNQGELASWLSNPANEGRVAKRAKRVWNIGAAVSESAEVRSNAISGTKKLLEAANYDLSAWKGGPPCNDQGIIFPAPPSRFTRLASRLRSLMPGSQDDLCQSEKIRIFRNPS
jgi:hypothetical protein